MMGQVCHASASARIACNVPTRHGETAAERAVAQRLLVVLDARRSVPRAQREDRGRAAR